MKNALVIASRISAVAAVISLLWLPHRYGAQVYAQGAAVAAHGGLANSPWPKMLGNARNTGMSAGAAAAIAKPWLFEDLGASRAILGAPALDGDGTLYIGADSLYALDAATGKQRWGKHVSNLVLTSPIVGLNKIVYASIDITNFCAFDGISGKILWRFECKPEASRIWKPEEAAAGPQNTSRGFVSAGALAADGTLYVTSLEGRLYALDSRTGDEKWRFSTHYAIYGSPTIGADGTVYFTSVGTLFAVDGKTGKKKWIVTDCDVRSTVAIGSDGTLYVDTFKNRGDKHQDVAITAFDGQTGELKWTFPMGRGAVQSPAVGEDGTIFAGFEQSWEGPAPGKVVAIDGKTGLQKWAFPTPEGVFLAPSIDSDGTIYIGSKAGIMYALNGATGVPKWQQNVGAEIGTPVAIGANGLIYFGANDGTVYALRAKDGARAPGPQ